MKKLTTTLLLSLAISVYAHAADSYLPINPEGEIAGHAYVDLGLPTGTLWATSNIYAESSCHPGRYFAWGETEARDIFKWHDYLFFEEEFTDDNGILRYSATNIGEQISGTEYDAAHTLWGDCWRMPTKEDWEELIEYCTAEYKEYVSPDNGLYICGPNGNSILLPLTFSPHGGASTDVLRGEYWSATSCSDLVHDIYPSAMMLSFNPADSKMKLMPDSRHDGLSIRPVISRKDISTSVATLTDFTPSMKYEDGVIILNGYTGGSELTVSDLSGRNICSDTIDDNICPLPALSKGIYIVAVRKSDKTLNTIKIAVK
ncbi:MAG: T9SS type A sorting domain-containing protein [Muribaculaceae bacterium]|nr:T9SS type A sorting domain-containing protein [Muribaculaceae bacterium]